MRIQFFFIETSIKLNERRRLKLFIDQLFKTNNNFYNQLSIIFCSDAYLLDINKKFLKHDYYTDIITFNLADLNQPIEGEIYISIDRVRDNAGLHMVSVNRELHRIIFHGVLHLCGFKDKTPKHKQAMTFEEDKCLNAYLS